MKGTGIWGYCARVARRNFCQSLLCLGMALLGMQEFGRSASAAELEVIQARGYLIVAVKDNLRPLGFRTADGQIVGLEIDLAHRLAEALLGDRHAVTFVLVSNAQRLPALINGEVDLVIAQVTATDSRARLVDFSPPYYLDGTALVTRDETVQQLVDVSGQRVAVLNDSSTIAVVRSFLPTVTLIGVSSYQEAFATLESGQAIAFAADASVLAGWVQEHPHYQLLPALLSGEPLCVAMPRGTQYDDLRRRVNAAIVNWQTDGWLPERIAAWGLPQ
jgi:polar amino acid transport system substrate-binding protein